MYAKSIIIKGLLIPCTIGAVLWFGASYLTGEFRKTKESKELTYGVYLFNKAELDKITVSTKKGITSLKDWKPYFDKTANSRVSDVSNEIESDIDETKLIKLGGGQVKGTSGPLINRNVTNGIKIYRFDQEWEGSYESIQSILAEQETLAPDLIVEKFSISPSSSSALEFPSLRARINYATWDSQINIK